MPFSRWSNQPKGRTCVSCIGRWVLSPLPHQCPPLKVSASLTGSKCPLICALPRCFLLIFTLYFGMKAFYFPCCQLECYPPGSPAHEILQTRILEWVAMPFSRVSVSPRDRSLVSFGFCNAGGFFSAKLPKKPQAFCYREQIWLHIISVLFFF